MRRPTPSSFASSLTPSVVVPIAKDRHQQIDTLASRNGGGACSCLWYIVTFVFGAVLASVIWLSAMASDENFARHVTAWHRPVVVQTAQLAVDKKSPVCKLRVAVILIFDM